MTTIIAVICTSTLIAIAVLTIWVWGWIAEQVGQDERGGRHG